MVYSGGPYLSILDLNASFDLNYGSPIGPINIPYQRVNESLQLISEQMVAAYVPWEWWINYSGIIYLDTRRGSDKSASVTITVSKNIGRINKEISSKQTFQRCRVVGRGESAEQDLATSDWFVDAGGMEDVNSFYEKIETEKSLSSKDESDILAQVILTENAHPRQEITITLTNDDFTVNDFDVGDDVTVYDSDYAVTAVYRVMTIDKLVDDDGENTQLTLTKVKTDITKRLAYLQRQLEKLQNSSTFLDSKYAEGSNQTKIGANEIEDIWEQTASNKWAIELPEDEADDTTLVEDQWAGRGDIAWACDKDEFEIYGTAVNAAGEVFKTDPLLNFSRNPRFTCEFEIDTTGADRDEWQEDDLAFIQIKEEGETVAFGFRIKKTASQLELYAELQTPHSWIWVKLANLEYDIKYIIEARMEWKSKVILFYFGKSDVEESDEMWGYRLRGILPLDPNDDEDYDNLCPFHVTIDASSGATKTAVVIYRWKTQAIRVVKP